jgi:hypothetical protein
MQFSELKSALGYTDAPLYREDDGAGLVAPEDLHLVRLARASGPNGESGVKGTFFFKTSPEGKSVRPAVHLAELTTAEEARVLHRRLWNQGINPFLIVLLPGEIRVYTGFAYHPDNGGIGLVNSVKLAGELLPDLHGLLAAYNADAINRGEIWERQEKDLRPNKRVDSTLLQNLKELSRVLQENHGVSRRSSHALIGRFVYLHYLRARRILSDKWLEQEAKVTPDDVFSVHATLAAFRRLSKEVEATFNGRIFPIPWGDRQAPTAKAVKEVARVFAGEDPASGQMALPFTAYDFSYIPIELLSSIYEQFLHAEGPDASEKDGAHYTPEPLAEYLVSEVQAALPMHQGMRILDPCCGSGIFLVVAFRRLVEHECAKQRSTSLPPQELKKLLTRSIYGVERNKTACEIAAFSLILAMLTYIDPPALHKLKRTFKFPTLKGRNLFAEDFFAEDGCFWKKIDPDTREPILFDWILGNPPWIDGVKASDQDAEPILRWIGANEQKFGLARKRTSEAFACRILEKLAKRGVAGLVLGAKTLVNDHLKTWRAKFFSENRVHRVTNFANLAYVIFPTVKEPAMTISYSACDEEQMATPIRHVGPFVANQVTVSHTRKAWVVGITESEIKLVDVAEATRGDASTWKLALWGNYRDARELARLKALLPETLGTLAAKPGWHLALGLQLRKDAGKEWQDDRGEWKQENEYVKKLEGLRLLDHKALVSAGACLEFREQWQVKNNKGCFVRTRGGTKGIALSRGPHLFLWNEFAAFSEDDYILEHDKIGLKCPKAEANWLRAISLIWTSSITQYFLFFELNAAWGVGRSQIDLGDAENVRMPMLDEALVKRLGMLHSELATELSRGKTFDDHFRRELDRSVGRELNLPESLMKTVTDFAIERLALNQGKAPADKLRPPNESELHAYAAQLTAELDGFVGGKARHRITILRSSHGICASIEITRKSRPIAPVIKVATGDDAKILKELLKAAETKESQWIYVRRSIRIMDDGVLRLFKPPRRLEWTEARALLDAGDIIAEIVGSKK